MISLKAKSEIHALHLRRYDHLQKMESYLRLSLLLLLTITVLSAVGCVSRKTEIDESVSKDLANCSAETVLVSEVVWAPLNPARGDKGPQAGNLWGDRTSTGPCGFLVRFVDGFSSPPHIHNITYRGVVIDGLIHNDDPNAQSMWMPAGSYWTQPAGEPHITSAKGIHNLAYIEIEEGPYLVHPTEDAFDNGQRPVNIDASNIVWLDASEVSWLVPSKESNSNKQPMVAFLWGDSQGDNQRGMLVMLQAGSAGMIRGSSAALRAILIKGAIKHRTEDNAEFKLLERGSYFGSDGLSMHQLSCEEEEDGCIIYIRTNGTLNVTTTQSVN